MPSFFFNDTATTEIYTLSLHDALPISRTSATRTRLETSTPSTWSRCRRTPRRPASKRSTARSTAAWTRRSEEHTSELQSPDHLVCRLLLEKKKPISHVL